MLDTELGANQMRQRGQALGNGSGKAMPIMGRIGALHFNYPFVGSRMLCDLLRGESSAIHIVPSFVVLL